MNYFSGKRIFSEFNNGYMDRNGKQIRQEYDKQLRKFIAGVKITDDVVSEFMELGKKRGVTQNDEQFKKDKEFIRTRIKADIARDLFGNEGWYSIMHSEDNQVQKALTLFPEAGKIAGLR